MLNTTDNSSNTMLPYFPAGFPDETIGSRISRYHILRGQPTIQTTYGQLFDRLPFSSNAMVHPHLDRLAKKLPGSAAHNLMTLHAESTLGPLFQRFAGTRLDSTTTVRGNDAPLPSRPRRIRGDSRLTHICAQCLRDDQTSLGSPYIHRSHQIPGVTSCWRHETRLLDRCPFCRCPFARPNELILSAWLGCACGSSIAEHVPTEPWSPSEIEREFAEFTRQLLASETVPLSARQLVAIYKHRALELGYGWGDQKINRKRLFDHLEKFFGEALLGKMDPAYGKGKTSGWFHLLTPSSSQETPLNRHLIFVYFLFRDPSLFLSRSVAAANTDLSMFADTHASDPNVQKGVVGDTQPNDPAQVLFAELTEAAQRFGYDTQQLWQYHFSAMKRLVKLMPEASTVLDAYFRKTKEKEVRTALAAFKSRERLRRTDVKWSDEITATAPRLIWKDIRPVKITKHQLLNGGSIKQATWPVPSKYPLTCVALNQKAESMWHFYARRMLWTLQALNDPHTPAHKIIILAALEVNKARAVLAFFSDAPRGGGTSMEIIRAILKGRGIGTDWKGPCPEQEFYRAGRAYKLRTSRWGPIGGKAGDTDK